MSIDIKIPDSEWTSVDSTSHELVTSLSINGVLFHLEAIEVTTDGSNWQRAVGDDEHFGNLHDAFNAEGHYDTTTINGREYVLFGDAAQ